MVLRLRGRVVGTGIAFGPGPGVLERAVSKAIEPVDTDDFVLKLPRDERDAIGRELSLELELASEPQPMIGRTVGQIVARIEPALEALALRRGDRWTWTMPSVVQAANLASDPIRTCAAMLTQLAIDPRELPSQALPEGTSFYHAPTRRLAQLGPKDAPFEVIRGHEIIPLTVVGPAGRAEFAAAMCRHLRTHVTRPSPAAPSETGSLRALGIQGDYRPHLDRHRDLFAPPQDQAMAALALAAASNSPLLPEAERRKAAATAAQLLSALAEVAEVEQPPLESASAVALALLAELALDRGGTTTPARPEPFLESLREALAKSLAGGAALDHARAIELAAAAALATRGEPVVDRAVLDALLERAWSAPASTTLVEMLPWLLLAERERGSFDDPVRAKGIRERAEPVRRALLASQLGVGGPEESAPDAAGGFALTGGLRTVATSQSARPTLALAIMLGCPEFATPEELPDLLRCQLMALRFLRQLAVDERSCYAFRDAARTTGGVRDALWDSTQPVAATSMALLALVESERALRDAAERSRAANGKSGNP
ncbi:MAG: hypothetical protein FJ253_10120 [Phycisphaerae bacterium]|nr:hypothetical protein [Phycisphaerae bacterium]